MVPTLNGGVNAHPILFSAPMVRALLAGTKTQTRRAIKRKIGDVTDAYRHPLACPYGQARDRLWVREGFCTCYNGQEAYQIIYATGERVDFSHGSNATEDQLDWLERSMTTHGERGRPGIHLPRWASRITLEVVSVRAERLQDISEADAMAEGVEWKDRAGLAEYTARKLYRTLWESINGKGSWDANPWVWVVELNRLIRSSN